MAKVTSKLQVTLPKAIATAYKIRPGDEIEWLSGGDVIRVVPAARIRRPAQTAERLRLFRQATARQRRRQRAIDRVVPSERGWTREDVYDRGRAR